METTLTVNAITPVTSKNGKAYWSVETDQGKMSCFEKDIAAQLAIGHKLNVDVKESGNFKNIRSIMPAIKTEKIGNGNGNTETLKADYRRSADVITAEALTQMVMALYNARYTSEEDANLTDCIKEVESTFNYFLKK